MNLESEVLPWVNR